MNPSGALKTADPAVPSEEIVAKLRGINGIGPSSANYLLGFLGRHGHLSIDSATLAHVAATHTKGLCWASDVRCAIACC